jgi:hypothetical protein
MARKKPARKKSVTKKKPTTKKKAIKKAVTRKKTVAKKAAPKKKAAKKAAAKSRKPVARKKAPSKKKSTRSRGSVSGSGNPNPSAFIGRRGLGPDSAGQSGDTQGLSRQEYVDSESVEELMEEGQYMEAEAVSGVENAPDADEGEVHTREVPEDDVPEEYTDRDE